MLCRNENAFLKCYRIEKKKIEEKEKLKIKRMKGKIIVILCNRAQ